MRIKIRNPFFVVQKKEKIFVLFNCYHCGTPFFVHIKNIRTVNYCTACK